MRQTHISEIDSLRAIAVLSVMLFHAFPNCLPGGFIGVDIFFVISGFVISRAYLRALLSGERDLRSFYLARFRRLAPALSIVLLITSVAALFVVQPDRLVSFGWSLLVQPIYLQNFVFWSEGDYFNQALSKPLLHTWSLAVEEQFYILWAVFILVLRSRPKILVWVVFGGAVVSLLLGLLIDIRSPKTSFYHLPTRIWEFSFGIGAYLVVERFGERISSLESKATAPAAIGVIGIFLAAVTWSETAHFPGAQSVLACAATALVLIVAAPLSGHQSLFWLRLEPISKLGRISYGAYLWHWPPLALWFLSTGFAAPPGIAALLMLGAIVGASLSYAIIEEPIRRALRMPTPRAILAFTAASGLAAFSIGLTLILSNGFIQRYPDSVQKFFAAPGQRGIFRCGKAFAFLHPRRQACALYLAPESRERGAVLLLGDSHADVVKESVMAAARAADRSLYLAARNCEVGSFGSNAFCSLAVRDSLISEVRSMGVKKVLAISHWDSGAFSAETMARDLSALVDANFSIGLMRAVPEDDSYDPIRRAKAALSGAMLDYSGISLEQHRSKTAEINGEIDAAAALMPPGTASIYDPSDVLCKQNRCRYVDGGVPLYLDTNHLTYRGAAQLRPLFDLILLPR